MRMPFATAIVCYALLFGVAGARASDLAGSVQLPPDATAGTRRMLLNGAGIGTEMNIVKVYVIGLYLETKTDDERAAIATDQGKRIVLTMLRDVSRQKFVQAVERGMVRNAGPAIAMLRARLNRLEQSLPSLQKGSNLDFTYVPGAGTVVRGQGRQLTIPGKDFADALFSVWLGPKASNTTLKRQLLGG
jgi:hypothetical protein